MRDDAKSGQPDDRPACSWCGKELLHGEEGRPGRVCEKCLALLRNAGLPDEEIYGDAGGEG